jgi:hypothetical protein
MSQPSFLVTYYHLFLGNQDAMTGWYRTGYTIESIRMVVIPRGNVRALSGLGLYSRHDAVGLTNYAVEVGSIVKDAFDRHYVIRGLQPHTWGNQFGYYSCDLAELTDFPFISGFFGFEVKDGEPGAVVEGFEDGFERGYFAL